LFKLKRVELLGFKSFADRTRLDFGEGTVGVVGPNGCGKSNLSDAISWVLGEQSARSLRGERMADVIFNGTGTRPPIGMAEASLTLVDPEYVEAPVVAQEDQEMDDPLPFLDDATASPDGSVLAPGGSNGNGNGNGAGHAREPRVLRHRAGEITVTRRLFRSGESEYLINGESCRLRDIQDLFMGTGLGPESYAIIEQGRIGQILSSKPSDRRAIIEEAAGVSKFKTRKRLAEAKLESSRQNLARIADILAEVSKQMNSLKRQAAKARRYKEMHEELRGRLKVVLASRLLALESECRRLRQQLAAAQTESSQAAKDLDALERDEKQARFDHETLDADLTQLRQSIANRGLEKERLLARVEQIQTHSASLAARAEEAAAESRSLATQLERLEQEFAHNAIQGKQIQRDWAAAREVARDFLARQEALSAELGNHETRLEAGRQDLLGTVSRSADLRNQLVKAEEVGLALERQLARTESERSVVAAEYHRLVDELETSGAAQQAEETTLAGLARSVEEAASALETARSEESRTRTGLESLRREFSGAVARRQALEESLARHAYTTETVRRLLTEPIPVNGHHFRPLGVLADFVEVAPGYEEVVEEFLKEALDYVVVERHEEARSGIALLKTEGSGRSTFFVTQIPSNGHATGHSSQGGNGHGNGDGMEVPEAGLTRLRDLVRFEPRLGLNGDLPLPVLARTYVVEDAAAAERLAAAHPENHFLTPTGEHYHHRLVSGGRGASSGPLAMRRDYRELERRTADLEAEVGAEEQRAVRLAGEAARIEAELAQATHAKFEADKRALLSSEKVRQVVHAEQRAAERLAILEQEAANLGAERDAVLAQQASLRAELEAAAIEQTRREEEISTIAARARVFRVQLDSLAHDLVEAQARASGLEERCRSIEADRVHLGAQQQDLKDRLARLAQQQADWTREQQQLAEESAAARARLSDLQEGQRTDIETLAQLEEKSRTLKAHRDSLGPRIDAARARFESEREKRSQTEIALARAESDYSHGAEQCREELKTEPEALLAGLAQSGAAAEVSGRIEVVAGEALRNAEQELTELKARIENLGPVNMMALEELQEAEERFGFLETQRQDLLASIQDTVAAIREIDDVSRQQFLEAFKAINAYFAESFTTLFGGGNGLMRLSDEADPESGIDIVAQPPGKRLQNILLLSGGEKALAALALLIALFRFTPSPFCVLDEVDAPLDESNVDRFTQMIRHMSRHTQFILITHNKKTMETAKVLYGVTMEEAGVSKLVSVRFDEVEPEPVAAVA